MKSKLGKTNALYPSLTVLAGALVGGKPNFNCIAHVGIMNYGEENYLSLSMSKTHYTNQGIIQLQTFSVNVPGQTLVAQADYVGLVSGEKMDKSALFEVFYGELETAPMIAACPVCMECKLDRIVDFDTHDVFIGRVVQTYADPNVLTAGQIDPLKVDPLLFDMGTLSYYALGQPIAKCWNIGRTLCHKEKT